MDLSQITDQITQFRDESSRSFLAVRDSLMIKEGVDYPEPQYLVKFGGVPTIPRGNLVAITAKWKNGKTFLCDVLCAVFLGSDRFPGFTGTGQEGKVMFFDTEQDVTDTARIKRIIDTLIPEQRRSDLEVFCLRGIDIEGEDDQLSRYDFISQAIEHTRPAMVVVDGIADLIYNYNDVIESQNIVNNLAALASQHNCAIVTVMHQNKGKQDTTMKGHIGTMLYQKCSDVFSVQKFDGMFVCRHVVSRHSNISDFYFSLTDDGVPCDFKSDNVGEILQRIRSAEGQDRLVLKEKTLDEETLKGIFGESDRLLGREMIARVRQKFNCSAATAYRVINNSLKDGMFSKFGHYYFINTNN